ncbi:MAG: EscU/YscU/HrcU family type III secretion system export apparatus switch protein, partial [bacterium]|nr:EscU/YscU/HrcU family type III secretion system export apparatus switch protein [bacterium]MDW8163611.1 EscU/YscU/HrcU family type III secretion system export apparatus switch protein [Candidatus Omnitrophota bacterium]
MPDIYEEETEVNEEEKTEPPTSRKRERAVERGYVVKSIEVNNFFVLLSLYLFFILIGSFLVKTVFKFFKNLLFLIGNFQLTQQNFYPFIIKNIIPYISLILLPVFIYFPLICLFSNFIQTGFSVQENFFRFDIRRINIITNFKNIFSLNLIQRICITTLKFSIGLLIIYFLFKKILWQISILPFIPIEKEFFV